MKKGEIIVLKNVLENALTYQNNNKFRYAVMRNLDIIEPNIKTLKKMQEEDREVLKAHDEEYNALIFKYGKKEENGQVSIKETDGESFDSFNEEVKALSEKYEKELGEWKEKNKKFLESLEEEEEIKLYTVSNDFTPFELPNNLMMFLVSSKIIVE